MEPVNNLIQDYCIENKVAIRFSNQEDLDMLHGLFNRMKEPVYLWKCGGWVSYTQFKTAMATTTMQIKCSFSEDYILLSLQEFFTLALPNKSILESLK
jgi:hypothetical protein